MSFSIQLEPSGHSLTVAPGQTILDAAISVGVRIPYSCKSGLCRNCRATVASGEVSRFDIHPDSLSEAEISRGVALLCRTVPLSDCTIQVAELPDTQHLPQKMPVRVADITFAAPDVAIVRLRLPMNRKLSFSAGQYVDVLLEEGRRRSYSLSSRPQRGGVSEIEIHIRHLPGGLFTDRVFSTLTKSAMLSIEGPLGTFVLREDVEGPMLFLASGTGFAPIEAMIEDALERGAIDRRKAFVYWGGRRLADLYRLERARQWALRHPNITFVPVLSEPQASDNWQGRTGFVHQAAMADIASMAGWQVYACGAPVMVDAARRDFVTHRQLQVDSFFADSFLTQADLAATRPSIAS
ncbi:2Fe-2S iron-sulfur cluster-binding protein [Burkholderia cepacia]|uniref:2Fe-2S iron-sulfur cluster-binding protein n=1 Tax=Burkholderia cepacia TaxID=292 RepID=UPI003D666C50